ncbi:F-box only protein 39-like isoform X2 [Biomphalaria glabrata]|uniref:F-box only protein 39-like isoform X2 n=1 Tax=Biomphalaria glabrata TaxID=6526 RepID=A0A9W3BP36_BIOGL|nr:F-box only protein 39-like isoform X2 [Biomphalaria glabrata]
MGSNVHLKAEMLFKNKPNVVDVKGGVIRKVPDEPMESEEEQAAKRMKLTNNEYTAECTSNVLDQDTDAITHDWRLLPYVALTQIYSMLPNNDRYHMSLTCRNWGVPLTSPEIWRALKFKFNRVEDRKAAEYVLKVRPYALRYLNVDCKVSVGGIVGERDSIIYLLRLIRYLVYHKTDQLISLRLANMSRIIVKWTKSTKHRDLVLTLRRFLETQKELRILNLSCAGFTLEQALSISYEYLCDQVIDALIDYGKLLNLRIYVEDSKQLHRITSESWRVLQAECPDLEVHYVLHDVFHHTKFKKILLRGVPLGTLEWDFKEDMNDEDWDDQDVILCMKYTAELFHNTVRHITVGIEHCYYQYRKMFEEILKRCLIIETLNVNGPDDNSFKRALAIQVLWGCIRQPRITLQELNYNGKNISLWDSQLHLSIKKLLGQSNQAPS